MRYHDFHLKGYTVSDFGATIVLHLIWNYPGQTKAESHIQFSGVECYHFVHTHGAIITEIEEETLSVFVRTEEAFLSSSAKEHGLRLWRTDAADYLCRLEGEGFRAWRIESAIGFTGFVVGRTIAEANTPIPAR